MNKKILTLIICSVVTVIIWIVYTVYSNIFVQDYSSTLNVDQYTAPINTNMYLSTYTKLNDISGEIKVNNAQLAPSPTTTPVVSVTPTP